MSRGQLIVVGKAALILVVAVVLQILLVSRVRVFGVTADLFLVFTVVVAMSRGSLYGAVFGFCAGIVADIAFLQPMGLRSLIYVLTGYAVGMFVVRLGTLRPWVVFLLTGMASFVAQFVFGLFQYLMGPKAGFFVMLGTQMVPEAVFDALVAVPVYLLLVRLRLIPPAHLEPAAAGSASE